MFNEFCYVKEPTGLLTEGVVFKQRRQHGWELSGGLVQIGFCWVPAVVRVFGEFVAVVDLEGQEFVPTGHRCDVFGGFGADDRDVGWHDILIVVSKVSVLGRVFLFHFMVFFVGIGMIQFVEFVEVVFELVEFGVEFFLLFSQFVYFAGQTHSFPVQFDHDGPADIVIDLSQLIGINYLFD